MAPLGVQWRTVFSSDSVGCQRSAAIYDEAVSHMCAVVEADLQTWFKLKVRREFVVFEPPVESELKSFSFSDIPLSAHVPQDARMSEHGDPIRIPSAEPPAY